MTTFTKVNLADLPPPEVVETLEYETILASWRAAMLERFPAVDLESDPIVMLLEVAAYRETILRARYNDGLKGVLLATSTGTNLDNLAAFYATQRLVLDPGDPDAFPPIPVTMESDASFRQRVQLAMEAQSVAGPAGAYMYHALTADPRVLDVAVYSSTPGQVDVVVLPPNGDAVPELPGIVQDYLSADIRRPLSDTVVVQQADVIEFDVTAVIKTYPGFDETAIMAESRTELDRYLADHFKLGHDVTRSGISAALSRPGVQNVFLTEPPNNVVIDQTEVARVAAITLTFGGNDV